ncbi:cation/multidrug efflux pump [Vibrio ishigakensis]|uniref:Cation/multidrug efflux pump n=1 Tax=Vibrio ishigakensis TaxID=1481914 RepID=A0A0B8PIF8_9VIBR|nr:cation/multidrug efflux pump [Vibrio ishigakensis]
MMGFVSLAGIVVNDSILLVQYIRHHVDEGDSVHDSVVKASVSASAPCSLPL